MWELCWPDVVVQDEDLAHIDNAQSNQSKKEVETNQQLQINLLHALVLLCNDDLAKTLELFLHQKGHDAVDSFYWELKKQLEDANGMVTESSPIFQ